MYPLLTTTQILDIVTKWAAEGFVYSLFAPKHNRSAKVWSNAYDTCQPSPTHYTQLRARRYIISQFSLKRYHSDDGILLLNIILNADTKMS